MIAEIELSIDDGDDLCMVVSIARQTDGNLRTVTHRCVGPALPHPNDLARSLRWLADLVEIDGLPEARSVTG